MLVPLVEHIGGSEGLALNGSREMKKREAVPELLGWAPIYTKRQIWSKESNEG